MEESRIGHLVALAIEVRYGEDFDWETVTIRKDDGGFIVTIDTIMTTESEAG